jgi:uncharacterized membrane protein YoaT (DUF817 family)
MGLTSLTNIFKLYRYDLLFLLALGISRVLIFDLDRIMDKGRVTLSKAGS